MTASKIRKANDKIAGNVTSGFKKMSDGVVGSYTKIEDKFVSSFLERDGETTEEAKERLRAEATERKLQQKERREQHHSK